eukprot:gene9023-1620_t
MLLCVLLGLGLSGASGSPHHEDWNKAMDKLQNQDCKAATSLVMSMGSKDKDISGCIKHGFWGKMLRVVGAVGVAYRKGWPVRFEPENRWVGVNAQDCPDGLECLLEPISACPLQELLEAKEVKRFSACMHQNKENPELGFHGIEGDHGSNNYFGPIPREFKKHGTTWWQALLLTHVFKPGDMQTMSVLLHETTTPLPTPPHTGNMAQAVRESLKWDSSPVCGIHIRRGDKYAPGRQKDIDAFEKVYLPVLLHINREHKVNRFFLATDSGKIAQGAQAIMKAANPALELLTGDVARDYWNMKDPSKYAQLQATRGIVLDSYFLGCAPLNVCAWQTDYFVGTHTSSMSKVGGYGPPGMVCLCLLGLFLSLATPGENPGGWMAYVFGGDIDSKDWGKIPEDSPDL